MRISTSQMYTNSVTSMLNQQSKLAATQQQLSTGKRILTPSDDPVGAVRSLELSRAQEQTEQYMRNSELLDSRLRLEESVVGSSIDVVQRIRELTVQANNDSQSNESRLSIASELRQQLDNLLAIPKTVAAISFLRDTKRAVHHSQKPLMAIATTETMASANCRLDPHVAWRTVIPALMCI